MPGTGDIGGGCTVDFDVDQTSDGDRLQKFHVVDGPARGRGRKEVTITFPPSWGVPGNEVKGTLRGANDHITIKWT